MNGTHNIVFCGIKRLEQARRAPPAPENDNRLLLGIERQLRARVPVLLRDVIERPSADNDRGERHAAEDLEEGAPSGLGVDVDGGGGRGCLRKRMMSVQVRPERYRSGAYGRLNGRPVLCRCGVCSKGSP